MKKSEISAAEMDKARAKLARMEQQMRVRSGLKAGPAEQAYQNANGNAAFQPQVIALYGVVIGPV